jgi:hypothetical protein
VTACRAVVATRLHSPEHEKAILRRFRVLGMSGLMTDEPDVLARAAREAGISPLDLRWWMSDPEVEEALRDDMARARRPQPAALALDHKLADADQRGRGDGRRYTCPSYEIVRDADGARLTLPGFQPVEAYEPDSVAEVLGWADEPLATAEVAMICGIDRSDAHTELARVADHEPLGPDGFWTLAAAERLAA